MPNYENGQIYMIWSPHTDKVYIGSTTQPLHKRFYDHKRTLKGKGYTTANTIIDCCDAQAELIEDYPCASKAELNRREGQIIRERASDCVNKNVAGRTRAEWREDNKAHIAESEKAYRQIPEIKAHIAERMKAYQQIPEIKAHIAAKKREWQERPEVKERRNELARQRRQRKKQELLERAA